MGKAGELFACAFAVGPILGGHPRADEFLAIGRRVGLLYQRLDDLLDYCVGFDAGKPTLGDFEQRRWTWPLSKLQPRPFSRPAEEILRELRNPGSASPPPLVQCLERVQQEAEEILNDVRSIQGDDWIVRALVDEWIDRATAAVAATMAMEPTTDRPTTPVSAEIRRRVPSNGKARSFIGYHSRSFSLAAKLLPQAHRDQITRVYAYCRITDDLVDRAEEGEAEELLSEWMDLSRAAFDGKPVGVELLDAVMSEMRAGGVPFSYAEALADGMRMDLRGDGYETFADLRRYTYCVAGVVGQWLTRLFGVHSPRVLDDAARLGDAMQLTNIVRDVGEDLTRGRIYLPGELLRAHGIDPVELPRMAIATSTVDARFAAAIEEMMLIAESDYRASMLAIADLPRSVQAPITLAAHLYRGIHRSVRRNGFDTLHRRAHTTAIDKTVLAMEALFDLRRARRLQLRELATARQTVTSVPQ